MGCETHRLMRICYVILRPFPWVLGNFGLDLSIII